MERRSRRPGTGDGSNVLLGGERSEPTENTLQAQRPGRFEDWSGAPDLAVLHG